MAGKIVGFFLAFALVSAAPASAQVEKLTARTTGISCGSCAVVAEIDLRRRVVGLDKLTISMSQEALILFFKPDAVFQPQIVRDVLQPLKVGILRFELAARGRVQEQGAKRLFVAGKDQFVLMDDPRGPKIPVGLPILIEGVLDDRVDPMHVKVTAFKPVTP